MRDLSGSDAFFKFVDLALSNQDDLADENFVAWAVASGAEVRAFRDAIAGQKLIAKVDADIALARHIGATGTPAFWINGVSLIGAQPFEKFQALIDQQLEAAAKVVAEGVRPLDAYVAPTNHKRLLAKGVACGRIYQGLRPSADWFSGLYSTRRKARASEGSSRRRSVCGGSP